MGPSPTSFSFPFSFPSCIVPLMQRGSLPRPFRARMGGLMFALAVVVAAIWLLSRVQ